MFLANYDDDAETPRHHVRLSTDDIAALHALGQNGLPMEWMSTGDMLTVAAYLRVPVVQCQWFAGCIRPTTQGATIQSMTFPCCARCATVVGMNPEADLVMLDQADYTIKGA